MRLMKQLWMGTLLSAGALLAMTAGAQTFPTLGGNNARTGQNADPLNNYPGRANLTWFRPNSGDTLTGVIVRNNTALAPNVARTGAWVASPLVDGASFTYDQPSFGSLAVDSVIGGYANWGIGLDFRTPAYYYSNTVAATSTTNPTIGSTAQFTWTMDPNAEPVNQGGTGVGFARNYALYAWLPIGSTVTGLGRQYTQRYFVYEIRYGAAGAKRWYDVVDTYAAGTGYVRLGNGGKSTTKMFDYDGTTPITITLHNTVPLDPNTLLPSDNVGTSLVYADSAIAVPQVGEMRATPTMAYLAGTAEGRAIAAVNEQTIGIREGESVTVSQGVVRSYNYANGAFDTATTGTRWTFRPAEQTFTTTVDDLNSTGAGFSSQTIGVGTAVGQGTTYKFAPLTNVVGGTANATYAPTLEDGVYEVQMYLAASTIAQNFGQAVQVEVREGAAVSNFTINMDRASPGWVRLGTRKFAHDTTTASPLRVIVTNEGSAADVGAGRFAYADAVRFIGSFDSEVNSTPTSARVFITPAGGGAPVEQDVVIVASDDGHIYCLDGTGNGDGTTNVIWAYPSIADPSNPTWVDPNNTAGPDGTGGVTLAEMPTAFGKTTPVIQRIGGVDYVFIAARNGRVYAIEAAGRGDYNFATRLPGTAIRSWSYPNDYPAARRAGSLGSFTNGSVAFSNVGGTDRLYVPTESGHLLALNPIGNPATRTTTVDFDFPGRTQNLPAVTTTPTIAFGRVYFGTSFDSNGRGYFYSIDATNGGTPQVFTPPAGDPVPGAYVGGATVIDAATLGAGEVDTVYIANQNLNVYALQANNINIVRWRSDELSTIVNAPLTYTQMDVFDRTGVRNQYPVVMVPGLGGSFSAMFARANNVAPFNGVTNSFGFKMAWQNFASADIEAAMSVGGLPGFGNGFMYGGDMAGNLFAWSNNNTIGGQGNAPITEVIVADDPRGAVWRNAKVKVIDKGLYDQLRNDPTAVTYNTVNTLLQNPPFAFEWGQTMYLVVYGYPYNKDIDGNIVDSQSLVNFQISTDGSTSRQFAVISRQFPVGSPTDSDGYAILAYALQGSGANSMPPGRGRVSYTVSPARPTSGANAPQVAQNPLNYLDFLVANPIGIDMSSAGNDDIGNTRVTNDPGSLINGSSDLPGTPGNNESLLTSYFGLSAHAQTSSTTIRVYDRSLMTLLRGPGRGVDNIRVARPELEWLGGVTPGVIYKPIPTVVFGTQFEDLPDERPNVSLDYPNIKAEYIRVTKDPNGQAENPGFSGVFLRAPLNAGGTALVDEVDAPNRQLIPTDFQFDVDVPRFQPANRATPWLTSNGSLAQSGYSGRVNIFVDSDGNGAMSSLGGRLEAYRGFWLNGAVAADDTIEVKTPNVDLGSIPGGGGYSPAPPNTAGSTFSPWPAGTTLNGGPFGVGSKDFVKMFKTFRVENSGNVNLLNLRLAKGTNQGGTIRNWGLFSSSVDEFGWLDAGIGLWSDIDSAYAMTPQVLLQKSRVGDRGNSVLQTNPTYRENGNLGLTTGGRFRNLVVPFDPDYSNIGFGDDPRVATTVPVGFPVGTYSSMLRVIEDEKTDEALEVNGGNALEAYSEPGFTLTLKVRETRLTNSFTKLTAPMADDPAVLGTGSTAFQHQNLQPTAARTVTGSVGNLLIAWTSSRGTQVAGQPTGPSGNDQYRIFMTGLNGANANGAGDSDNGVRDLAGFTQSTGVKWFANSPSTANGYPTGGYLFPTSAGETLVANTGKYGAPALPARGQVNDVFTLISQPALFANFDMAFVGEAQKQTNSGRVTESRILMTRATVAANGEPTLDANPVDMPFDVYSQKGRPSVVRIGDLTSTPAPEDLSFVAYSAQSTGTSRLFWTYFDYLARNDVSTHGFTNPKAIDLGDGFESAGSPSVTLRPYTGNGGLGIAVYDLAFTGKLRGRKNSEVFAGRMAFADPSTPVNFPRITLDKLTPDSETGLFRARGVEWDLTVVPNNVNVYVRNGVTTTDIEVAGTRRVDQQTGLMSFDTTLGGKAYIDPHMGTVRLSTGLPLTTSELVVSYTPKFIRVSATSPAGFSGVTQFFDNRNDGVTAANTKYWANANGSGITPGGGGFVNPRVARFFYNYNRAAAGAGQSARPFMKTMRLGVALPYQIYTNANGSLVLPSNAPSITVTGNTGPFQVDPVKGRVYFSPADEDRTVTITFNSFDPSTGAPNAATVIVTPVTLVSELAETPVPIEQAVNESGMFAFPDPLDAAGIPRPNLVWMFWSSTRGGSPDIYFQTVAPRFAPQPSGN